MTLIFGIREEAWPKRHGYLYVKYQAAIEPKWLCDLDLMNVADDVLVELFSRALRDAIQHLRDLSVDLTAIRIETENISAIAKDVLLREWKKLTEGSDTKRSAA